MDETKVLGCLYINPCPPEVNGPEATIRMWVRQTEYDKGLDEVLFDIVKDWINSDWPFRKVIYPDRE
ncbi:MAG: hypothetical protein ACFE9R_07880 [Candidatus Hermodarchaeota archaeon]